MANKNKKYKRSIEDAGNVADYIDAIYSNNPKEEFLGEPEHHYDFTQSEEWANANGYYPDKRGHRDDRVKKPAHPSHPSRGTWEGNNFILTNKNNLLQKQLEDLGIINELVLSEKRAKSLGKAKKVDAKIKEKSSSYIKTFTLSLSNNMTHNSNKKLIIKNQ